jgi:hypothetical protein
MSETSGRTRNAPKAKAPGKKKSAAKGRAKNKKRAGKPSAEATKAAQVSKAVPGVGRKADQPAETPGAASRPIETPPAMDAATESAAGGEATASADTAAAMRTAVPPAKPPSTIPAVLWTVALMAVAVGAIYATRPFWFPYFAESLRMAVEDPRVVGIDGRLKALEDLARTRAEAGGAIKDMEAERARFTERLKVLMDRMNALENTSQSIRKMVSATVPPADAQHAEEALRELSRRLSDLERGGRELEPLARRVVRLEEGEATVAKREAELRELEGRSERLKGLVDGLGARLDNLEKTTGAGVAEGRAETVVLAVGQLREALKSSAPFVNELQALRAVAVDGLGVADALQLLRPHAGKGIPTLEELRARFERVASDIARASMKLEGEGWMARVVNRLMALVTIRRAADEADLDGAEGAVARAETSLKRGDLETSIAEVGTLDGAAAETAAPWLAAARARLAAEQAMAKLHVHAISLLGRPAR